MKALFLTIGLVLVSTTAHAQDAHGIYGPPIPRPADLPRAFELKIVEFRLPQTDTRGMSAAEVFEIYQQAADGKVEVVHTLHLRALSGHAIQVENFEESVVTNGTDDGQEQALAETPSRETLGASLVATIHWQSNRTTIDMSYISSHVLDPFQGDESQSKSPRIAKCRLTTSLILEEGKTTILGGGQGRFTSFLALDLSNLP